MYEPLAPLYDQLMADVDYDAWCDLVLMLLSRHDIEPKAMIDAACGTGQMTIRLAKKGISVIGCDISEAMLSAAQQNARANGLHALRALQFARMDICHLQSHRAVDAVLCACDGVNYLTRPRDVKAFFAAAWKCLRPGGALVFDISTMHKYLTSLDGSTYGEELDGLVYLWRNSFDPISRLCEMELILLQKDSSGAYRRSFETHTQKAHTQQELTAWLRGAGFSRVAAYSHPSGGPALQKDDRVQFVAVK